MLTEDFHWHSGKEGNIMVAGLKREAPISIYPPIILYNKQDIDRIWEDTSDRKRVRENSNLYLHIPFCAQRCDFCYYTSFTAGDSVVRSYVDALKKEIGLLSRYDTVQNMSFHTIYFGGGTPTYLKTEYLCDIIQTIRSSFEIQEVCEFCIEVRPGREATEEKLRALYNAGVNRISMGAQSFSQEVLDLNGRKHKLEEFYRVYELLRNIGFLNVNIDIMSGMIGDTEESWDKTVDTVMRLCPENITVYKMHVFKSSELYRKLVETGRTDAIVEDSVELERFKAARVKLENSGYQKSATPYTFTRSKTYDHAYRASRTGGSELLGIGLSSNSFVNRTVYQNTNYMEEYLSKVQNEELPVKSAYKLTEEEEIKRALIFALKTSRIDRTAFKSCYGIDPLDVNRNTLGFERMQEEGLAEISGSEILLTRDAQLYTDDIVRKYLLSDKERKMESLLLLHKNVRLRLG
jgi:oxygen-independent coproporphyrinogen III oxidase